jgi:hypothetical protein
MLRAPNSDILPRRVLLTGKSKLTRMRSSTVRLHLHRCLYQHDVHDTKPVEALGDPGARQEVRNDRALAVYNRVQNKLTGWYIGISRSS